MVLSAPQSHGAYAHVDDKGKMTHLQVTLNTLSKNKIYFDDPLRLAVAYEYIAKKRIEPPDGHLYDIIAFLALVFTFLRPVLVGYKRLLFKIWYQRISQWWCYLQCKPFIPPQKSKLFKRKRLIALATLFISRKKFAMLAENVAEQYLTSWDTDGVFFCVDNCATCIICNDKSMFVGDLTPSNSEVLTSNGQNVPALEGTLRISITDDQGVPHQYDIPGALYDPESPFNLLGIPFLSQYFGDHKDMGTKITSGCYQSHFIWDHEKHERHFQHGIDCLPTLQVNEGQSYFKAFCSRVSTFYNDRVRFSFRTKTRSRQVSYKDSDIMTITKRKRVNFPDKYSIGQDLIYKDGCGNNVAVVYEGARPEELMHDIRFEDGTIETVDESQLLMMHQPDLTNLPSTPQDYQREVANGYLPEEDAKKLAQPRVLSPTQQLLMMWHHRLFHLPFRRMFMLAERGWLPKSILNCKDNAPLCVVCQFGSAHRRPWRAKGKKSGSIRKAKEVEPGDGQSIDQIVSSQPGLIPQMSGFLTSERYFGATTIVDHVSDYVYVHLMRNLSLEETLIAKRSWEKILHFAGRNAKHYQADNGRFADQEFLDDCTNHNQSLTFCGVGAHHQNGIVEGKNKVLTQGARTLLLHGMRMWSNIINSMFWPFALKAMAERMNKLHIHPDGSTPESRLYGIDPDDIPVGNYHTLFCPVYVLDSKLQNAGGIGPPKWNPRARIGVYLGHSPFHAGNVALVFNPTTGHVSPQFHVVFDDEFSTVPFMEKGQIPPNWDELYNNNRDLATDEDFNLAKSWYQQQASGVDGGGNSSHNNNIDDSLPATNPFDVVRQISNIDQGTETTTTSGRNVRNSLASAYEGEAGIETRLSQTENDRKSAAPSTFKTTYQYPVNADSDSNDSLYMPTCINLHESGLRRSERIKNLRQDANGNSIKQKAHKAFGTVTKKIAWLGGIYALITSVQMPSHPLPPNASMSTKIMNKFHECNELYDGTINQFHNYAFVTELANNEVFTYTQAMRQDDREDFIQAMIKEVEDHEGRDHWELVLRSTIPKGIKTIQAIWSFKRKRFPDGTLNKHKARLCAHGGMQQWGENYWETYSPVVNMLTVRLILIIAHVHKLDSKSIDFVLAFPQADLDVDIWMELPRGMVPDHDEANKHLYVLKLKKNLYGLKQASFNWFDKLKNGLMDRDFKPSKIDACLYYKKGMIVLTYVDDCIIIGDKMKEIDEFVKSMQNGPENFILTDEGDIDKFLGIEIEYLDSNRFELKQPFLIERICRTLGLIDNDWDVAANTKSTPVGKPLLNKDLNGKPRKLKWKYRTAVGMLSYLQGNTRPEISMATHQTARFSNDPKLSHEQAIMRIGRYLLGSMNRGIVYEPDPSKGLECYVDADFAGGWSNADADDADNLLSRMGYVFYYANCPVYWCSKMAGEITLSTSESEYVALSSALREVIPLMTLMEEINEVFPLHIDKPNFLCKVFEDNQSCIKMAVAPKFTPRTKHIALKYHHFKAHVGTKINISYIHTDMQKADIFTKPLTDEAFFRLRFMLMGW
jgi:hypothetical protein